MNSCFPVAVKCINIGNVLSDWVHLCYNFISTRILVNGQTSGKINVQLSVRQGCPLSLLLLAVYLDPLCQAI